MKGPRGIRSERIVTPDGVVDGTLHFSDGLIQAVEGPRRGPEILDVGSAAVLPGLVDTHVHINEPGRTNWEGFATATRAAAAGGVTTLVDMPLNSLPVTTTSSALEAKIAAATGQLYVDCGFYGGVVPDHLEHLPSLIAGGVLGLKAFMVDSGIPEFPPCGAPSLRAALDALGPGGPPLLVHAEQADPNVPAGFETCTDWAMTRPQRWEANAIELLIQLVRETGAHIHVVHLAAADCLDMLQSARTDGLPITVETCPHYLFFATDTADPHDCLLKCAPPIRDRANAERLLKGLRSGTIDCVVSDHSPAPAEMKVGGYADAWGGVSSLELGLRVMWTLLQRAPRALSSLAHWMSTRPSELVGLRGERGAIEPGLRADLVVFDTDSESVVEASSLHCRHKITPYAGQALSGSVRSTFLGGDLIYDQGRFLTHPSGRPLLRDG